MITGFVLFRKVLIEKLSTKTVTIINRSLRRSWYYNICFDENLFKVKVFKNEVEFSKQFENSDVFLEFLNIYKCNYNDVYCICLGKHYGKMILKEDCKTVKSQQ